MGRENVVRFLPTNRIVPESKSNLTHSANEFTGKATWVDGRIVRVENRHYARKVGSFSSIPVSFVIRANLVSLGISLSVLV
jgi:predicted fused transcriptional regulator/phosphomethylpyrimidine kinase